MTRRTAGGQQFGREARFTETWDYRLYTSLERPSNEKKRAEIDLNALRSNYVTLRTALLAREPSVRMIAVVKADAYGHGAPACVRALLREGCDFFAVSCIEEAIPVRRVCEEVGRDAEILILGYTAPDAVGELLRYRLTQALLSESYALALQRCAQPFGRRLHVHAAINTGMNRIGFDARTPEEAEASADALARIAASGTLTLTGVFTHFAKADEDDADGLAYTELQSARERTFCAALEAHGCQIPFRHVCNSAAALRGTGRLSDGVRLGIALYGGQPTLCTSSALRPVMRLKAEIVHLFDLPPNERLGYGGTFCSDTARRIAVLPIGYADGFLRAYSGAIVTLTTQSGTFRVPIVGRICMDQCMLDVSGTDAAVGDCVTLFGEGSEQLTSLAARGNTIDYESLCLISARVPRVYVGAV